MAHFDSFARHWNLEPGLAYLNHGAFGACPRSVLQEQARIRSHIERQPSDFFERQLFPWLDSARQRLAEFVGADAEALAFVTNPTSGVNAVLSSLRLNAGDEVLATDHTYNACRNALDQTVARWGATVRTIAVPFPLTCADEVVTVVLEAVGPNTRIALLDHVTSPTGLVMPIARLVTALAERGVESLVDGAHAPGMLPLELDALGAAWYAGHCHKWMCAPKGAAFLYVREDKRDAIRPLVISHGLNRRRAARSLYHDLFDWSGTHDPSAFLCVPAAIDCIGAMLPGGWPAVMARNHALAIAARALLTKALGIAAPAPDEMIGTLVTLPIPQTCKRAVSDSAMRVEALRQRLREHERIEVPILSWGANQRLHVRISAQLYNGLNDYERLAGALQAA